MTLGAYFATIRDHQRLAWMSGTTLEILVDSARNGGQVLIMRSDTTRGSGVPVHVHQREDEILHPRSRDRGHGEGRLPDPRPAARQSGRQPQHHEGIAVRTDSGASPGSARSRV